MTEASRQIPPNHPIETRPSDHREYAELKRKEERRAEECSRLLTLYLTAIIARDKFYNEGLGKTWTESIGVLPGKPKLTPEQNAEAAQTAKILQDTVDANVKRLQPFGFAFDYTGRLIAQECQGFAANFLTNNKFDKFRQNLNLAIAESRLQKPSSPPAA